MKTFFFIAMLFFSFLFGKEISKIFRQQTPKYVAIVYFACVIVFFILRHS